MPPDTLGTASMDLWWFMELLRAGRPVHRIVNNLTLGWPGGTCSGAGPRENTKQQTTTNTIICYNCHCSKFQVSLQSDHLPVARISNHNSVLRTWEPGRLVCDCRPQEFCTGNSLTPRVFAVCFLVSFFNFLFFCFFLFFLLFSVLFYTVLFCSFLWCFFPAMLCFFSLFFSSVFFSFFFHFFVSFNFSLFSCFLVFLVSVFFFLFFLALFFLFLFFLLLFFLFLFLSVPFLFVSFPFLSFSFFFVLVLVLLHSPFPLPLSRSFSFSSRLSFFCCFCLSFFLSFPPCVSWLLSGGFDSHPFQEWIYSLNVSWSLSLDSSGFEERLNHAPAVSQIVVPGFWSWGRKKQKHYGTYQQLPVMPAHSLSSAPTAW